MALSTNTRCDLCGTDLQTAMLKTVPGRPPFVKVNNSQTGASKLACVPCGQKLTRGEIDFDGKRLIDNEGNPIQ